MEGGPLTPLALFAVAVMLFKLAYRKQRGVKRSVVCVAYILCNLVALQCKDTALFSGNIVAFAVGHTIHSAATLLFDPINTTSATGDWRAALRALLNVRRLAIRAEPGWQTTLEDRVACLTRKGGAVAALSVSTKCFSAVSILVLRWLQLQAEDFAPEQLTLLPPSPVLHHVVLRLVVTSRWMWSTYSSLIIWHNLGGILFVGFLSWDQPADWPPLLGDFSRATTVRGFWGRAWQKLHVRPFATFMPRWMKGNKALEALWQFTLSALCHAYVDWLAHRYNTVRAQVWFLGTCYLVCLFETVTEGLRQHLCSRAAAINPLLPVFCRVLGHLWVITFFIATAAGWQYPLVWAQLEYSTASG